MIWPSEYSRGRFQRAALANAQPSRGFAGRLGAAALCRNPYGAWPYAAFWRWLFGRFQWLRDQNIRTESAKCLLTGKAKAAIDNVPPCWFNVLLDGETRHHRQRQAPRLLATVWRRGTSQRS